MLDLGFQVGDFFPPLDCTVGVGVFYGQYYLWGRSSDHKLGGSTRCRKQDAEFRQVRALGKRYYPTSCMWLCLSYARVRRGVFHRGVVCMPDVVRLDSMDLDLDL